MVQLTCNNYHAIVVLIFVDDAVSIFDLADRVRPLYLATRFVVDEETWPPYQFKIFAPLLLMHYKGHRTLKQVEKVGEQLCMGKIDDLSNDIRKVTKEIAEILLPLQESYPCFILIEGAPGIGKSVLLKEISHRWANKQLLQTFTLVLLVCLRDPMVQQSKSVDDLLQLYCRGDRKAAEIVSASSAHLCKNGGKGLTLLLDGFDELPEDLQKNSLIADILKRRVLPNCGLVLSSRPHASENFRIMATVVIDILGFTEEDRKHYIENTFQQDKQKAKDLLQYLDDHPHINSLCYVPFNMTALLYLYDEQEIPLPKNFTDIYNYFICLTICRHLSRSGQYLTNITTDLSNLPEPYNKIIEQLSTLSLKSLEQKKLVFTLDEIKTVCPDIEAVPGAINGFGLLQAVKQFGLTGRVLTFHFLHSSIQEYLAACCITKLNPPEELQILKDRFWFVNYFNTFTIYVALTKGQRPSFKEFLCDGDETINIAERFLNNHDLCFRLYRCFYEAGDEKMCKSIARARIFNNKLIYSRTSSPTYVECLALFLTTSSHQSWEKLRLRYIQDFGFHILYRSLNASGITITELWLTYSCLTSSSSLRVSNIVISCRVKRLLIDGNETIGENKQLYSMLSNSASELEVLSLYKTKLSSRAADILFTTLVGNNTLKALSIDDNDVTDNTCLSIANTITHNNCLVKLWMHSNPIKSGAIRPILEALQSNSTLESLRLPDYPHPIKMDIKSMEEKINKARESYGCYTKLFIDFSITEDPLN